MWFAISIANRYGNVLASKLAVHLGVRSNTDDMVPAIHIGHVARQCRCRVAY